MNPKFESIRREVKGFHEQGIEVDMDELERLQEEETDQVIDETSPEEKEE